MEVSLNDTVNQSRRTEYQCRSRGLLQERVDMEKVKAVLSTSENGHFSVIKNEAYNGFYACISALRHAFRWGTVPVVKVAQRDKIIQFPPELDLPWGFIRRRYGITSQGGNVMSNLQCNIDNATRRVAYAINGSMPEPIPSAEYYLIYSFTEPERKALPVYYHLVQSIRCYEKGQRQACLAHLQGISIHLKSVFRIYYENVVESKIPRHVFTAYIQGFHGWAAGEFIEDEYVEYDGTSGAHLVLFNVLDYFLGLEPFFDEQDFMRYFSHSQRRFMASVKAHAFRTAAEQANNFGLTEQFEKIAKQLRSWNYALNTVILNPPANGT
ncbi:uncharacterized protein N7496_006862 [Penicillium cataractarum]|uniref:Indoleamine 2,3-dioxygenase n=1 Tax=Penicillium cataractarum TaxID=2100454 RepID=A0A9W9S3Q2_9EURO|nr:uncharacterized protein N7496_006862 [Penicillium cataractarum]KAJ5370770.1 hypothetical protein N7496_006862 [Penicillium cataractarum]